METRYYGTFSKCQEIEVYFDLIEEKRFIDAVFDYSLTKEINCFEY
jgi:hypothetical protein